MIDKRDLYSEEKLKKASELDELNRYLKVPVIGAWVVLSACVLLLAGIFLWAAIAKIDDRITGVGRSENGVMTCYFRQEDISRFEEGAKVAADGKEYEIESIVPSLLYVNDMPRDILYLSRSSNWYQTATAKCDLEDGIYRVTVDVGTILPISFMRERNDE